MRRHAVSCGVMRRQSVRKLEGGSQEASAETGRGRFEGGRRRGAVKPQSQGNLRR